MDSFWIEWYGLLWSGGGGSTDGVVDVVVVVMEMPLSNDELIRVLQIKGIIIGIQNGIQLAFDDLVSGRHLHQDFDDLQQTRRVPK